MSTYPAHIDLIDNQGRRVPATTIKPSTLGPEVGLGIFAAEDIFRGEHMGWYYGEVYTEHPENGSHYMLEIERKPCWVPDSVWKTKVRGQGLFIDGQPAAEGGVQYRFSMLNHDGGEKTNVKFLQNGRVVALKNIKEGDELFLNYGPLFFSEDP